MKPLDAWQCRVLADALDDTPETVITIHALRMGRCRAYALGDPAKFEAAVVDPKLTAGEMLAFGNADAVFEIVRKLADWTCVEVSPDLAEPLSRRFEKAGWTLRRVPDVYYTMREPARRISHPAVRLLSTDDAELYASQARCFGDDPDEARQNVLDGPIAAGIVDGRVAAVIEANVRTARHANFCAETLAKYRGLGLSSAAASIAAQAVQAMGLVPVWSTSEDNLASRRVAEKVGFVEWSRWVYLIPQRAPAKV